VVLLVLETLELRQLLLVLKDPQVLEHLEHLVVLKQEHLQDLELL
jgi:hypothetical protein